MDNTHRFSLTQSESSFSMDSPNTNHSDNHVSSADEVEQATPDIDTTPAKKPTKKRRNILPGSPAAKKRKMDKEGDEDELHFGTLIPFKNHDEGLKSFSYNVRTFTTEPAPRHFVEALETVMKDETLTPRQTDPLGIVEAWKKYDEVRPLIFTKKAVLTAQESRLKDQVDKRFITYMQVLRCTHVVNIPVRVFCWLACKNGCPSAFKDFNDRTFRQANMDAILDMLEGKPDAETWNNIHNTSMHLMLKFEEEELRKYISPEMSAENFALLTPKEIGALLEQWFQSLDTPDLESKKELEGCLIPKAGQHRCGGIPRFVHKLRKNPAQWQSVLGSHLSINFWLKEEQPVANYLSGVSNRLSAHEFTRIIIN